MVAFNKVILIGRLVRDPEMRYTQGGTPITRFRIAVDRPPNPQGERETDFIDIVAWNKVAESCGNSLTKGRLVAVEGRLQIREFQTQDGQRRRVAEVRAGNVQFLDKPKEWVSPEAGQTEKSISKEVPNDTIDLNEDISLNGTPFASLDKEDK
jgi:single-strand DNA-binding protein